MSIVETDFETQEYKINLGPQHPSTHGVFRAVLTLNGEQIIKCENHIGYLHRGIEKLAEGKTYSQFAALTPRLDYLAGALNNWGYVYTVEKLMGIEVPKRAEYLRVIIGELQRIASHLVMLSSTSIDLNAVTAWMYGFTAREGILDLIEMVTGSRMTPNYFTIGGVMDDLPYGFDAAVKKAIAELNDRLADIENMVLGNEIFQGRTKNVGVITKDMAMEYGITGPNIRTAGIAHDLRKIAPYSVYDKFDFEVPVLENGDSFDRYHIRILEIRESVKIIEQALDMLPQGDISSKVPRIIKPSPGEVYGQIESAKGILGYYIVSDGSDKPYRLHIHSPSFVNIGIFPKLAAGQSMQNFIATLASFDICLGEIDR
ncbi:NADH-quinone oxidoreductase subunit 4 [Oxobacter pfennigii]|uniref:NADH-quinone oxidoreductase subunit D n=1 Tax=Oxobacter pfennigii TaxID=36849 RepID=A0A0P8WBS4_9CLOT|nr:NADH-quinone oxidoreductase subunit D [Oxobacter pfennigii]KPU46100.1 NADH-quinone oxidoreductase subunit 4 [Oxobacter pfennigii]